MATNREQSELEIRLNAEQTKKELKEVEERLKLLNKEKKEIAKTGYAPDSAAALRYRELDKEIRAANKSRKELSNSFKESLTVIINGDVAGKSLNNLRAALRLAKADFNKLIDPADMARQAASINVIQKQIDKLEAPIQKSKGAFSGLITEMKRMAVITASALGLNYVLHIFQDLVTSSAKFSNELSDLQRIGNLTEEQVNKLNLSLRKLDTPTSMSGLRNLAKEAARAGVEGVENLTKYTKALDMLVVVLGDELGDAGNISSSLGKILNVFNGEITADALTNLGNAIVSLANAGVASGAFITDFTQRVLAAAKAANFTLGATVGLAAGFEELGLKAESSGTAFQTLISTIGDDIPKAARIANKPLKEFQSLFDAAPQEALIQYAEGLVKNKGAFSEVTAAFKDAGEEGVRVRQTLYTIGQSGDFLREKITLGNKAMQETSAITQGFALKNENFAGIIEKIGKVLNQLYVNGPLTNGLKALAVGFYNLIKPTQNLTEESVKLIAANRQQINSSQKLLDEYQSLTKFGVEPTAKEKERLRIITLQLKDVLGDSVITIDKETGALKLNLEAVKEVIKQKLLLNNNEAASLALRADNAAKEKSDLIAIGKAQVDELKIRQEALKNLGLTENKAEALYAIILGGSAKYKAAIQSEGQERVDAVSAYFRSLQALSETNDRIAKKDKERLEIVKELQKLGFEAKDVSNLFSPANPVKKDGSEIDSPPKIDWKEIEKAEIESYEKRKQAFEKFMADRLKAIEDSNKEQADKQKELDEFLFQQEIDTAKFRKENAAQFGPDLRINYDLELAMLETHYKSIKGVDDAALKDKLATSREAFDIRTRDLDKHGQEYQVALYNELQKEQEITDDHYLESEGKAKANLAEMTEITFQFLNLASNLLQASNAQQNAIDKAQLDREKRNYDKSLDALNENLDLKLISREDYDKEVAKLDSAYSKKSHEIGKKEFERDKKASEVQIGISTAQAVMGVFKTVDNPYIAAALIAGIIALGAIQYDTVKNSQYPEYKHGGIYDAPGKLSGPSHADGGIDIVSNGAKIGELEGGELIVPKKVVNSNPNLEKIVLDADKNNGILNIPLMGIGGNVRIPSFNATFARESVQKQTTFEKGGVFNAPEKATSFSRDLALPQNNTLPIELLEVMKQYSKDMQELKESFKQMEIVFIQNKYEKFLAQTKEVKIQTQV